MKTTIYVDGFNLYYRALKGTPYKWLDIVALAKQLVPANHVVDKVKYFTARVSGAKDPTSPQRQHIYLRAIDTFQEVEIYYGLFLAKSIWRSVINLPVAGETISSATCPPVTIPRGTHNVTGPQANSLVAGSYPIPGQVKARSKRALPDAVLAEVHSMEEKGSDVNSGVPSAERCLEKLLRCSCRNIERYRSGRTYPHGYDRTEQSCIRGLPRQSRDGSKAGQRGHLPKAHPAGYALVVSASFSNTRDSNQEARGLVG